MDGCILRVKHDQPIQEDNVLKAFGMRQNTSARAPVSGTYYQETHPQTEGAG